MESQPDASRFVGALSGGGAYSVERGAAIIPVMGTLVNCGAWTGAYSGMTSYEGLEASISRALADDEVSRLVLDINSPGNYCLAEFQSFISILASFFRKSSQGRYFFSWPSELQN